MLTLQSKILISSIICITGFMSFLLGWPLQFVTVGILYLVASYAFIVFSETTYAQWKDYFLLAIPFVLVYATGSILSGNKNTYPIWVIVLINTYIGLVIGRNLEKSTAARIGIGIGIGLTMLGFPGMKNWISYLRNPNPRVWEIPPHAEFKNEAGEIIRLADMKGKTIVLDFWSTSCAPCAKKFPELDEITRYYKDDKGIVFASIYLPQPYDKPEIVANFGAHRKYTFMKLYSDGITNRDAFKVSFLPYMVVIDKNYKVRYRGSFHTEWAYMLINARKIIASIHSD